MDFGSPNNTERLDDEAIVASFKTDPERGYNALLERYSTIIVRMIRRFMRDQDEVMEVYTSICERFRANDFYALRQFRINSDLMPWLSVVVANACRDRMRKRRMTSVPQSVLSKLDPFEERVFKYYYWQRMPHGDITEILNAERDEPCDPVDVMRAIARIDDLLSVNKRWHLLVALNANRPSLSIDELRENGFQPPSGLATDQIDAILRDRERTQQLTEALGTLEPEDQLLVLLRFEHGMTAPQIAEVMHYENHKYVYTRLRTIMGRLRRVLVDE